MIKTMKKIIIVGILLGSLGFADRDSVYNYSVRYLKPRYQTVNMFSGCFLRYDSNPTAEGRQILQDNISLIDEIISQLRSERPTLSDYFSGQELVFMDRAYVCLIEEYKYLRAFSVKYLSGKDVTSEARGIGNSDDAYKQNAINMSIYFGEY